MSKPPPPFGYPPKRQSPNEEHIWGRLRGGLIRTGRQGVDWIGIGRTPSAPTKVKVRVIAGRLEGRGKTPSALRAPRPKWEEHPFGGGSGVRGSDGVAIDVSAWTSIIEALLLLSRCAGLKPLSQYVEALRALLFQSALSPARGSMYKAGFCPKALSIW